MRPMRPILLAAVAALALGGAGIAVAQSQAGSGAAPPGPPPGGPGRGGMMMRMDTDHNGSISRAEFDAGRLAMFTRMDANNDGAVTREEMHRPRPDGAPPPGAPGQRPERRNPDTNNDGAISRDEFIAGPAAMFDRLDRNHDGRLTADERPQHGGPGMRGHHRGGGMGMGLGLRGADANNDGRITRAEFTQAGTAAFTRLDTNRDGALTPADRPAPPPPAQ